MEARQVRDLKEAYSSIYAPQEEVEQLDEGLGGASIVKAAQRVIGSAPGSKAMSNLGQKAREVVDYSRKGLAGASDELNRLQQSAQSSIDRLAGVTRGSAASAARGVERDVTKANKYGPQVAKQMSKPGATRIEKPAPTGSKPGLLKQDYEYDMFDVILEHLVTEGYADTNQAALAIMANMSEEWKQSIVEASTETVSTLKDKIAKEKLKAELEDLQQKRNQRYAAAELKPGSYGVPSLARHLEQQKEYEHGDAGLTKAQSRQILSQNRRSLESSAGVKSGSTEKDAWYNDPNYGKQLTGKGKFFSPRTVLAKQGGIEGKLTADPNTGKKTFTASKWTGAEKGRYNKQGGK